MFAPSGQSGTAGSSQANHRVNVDTTRPLLVVVVRRYSQAHHHRVHVQLGPFDLLLQKYLIELRMHSLEVLLAYRVRSLALERFPAVETDRLVGFLKEVIPDEGPRSSRNYQRAYVSWNRRKVGCSENSVELQRVKSRNPSPLPVNILVVRTFWQVSSTGGLYHFLN